MSNRDMTFELLKDNYNYFFKNGHFDHRMAHKYLSELSNKTIRCSHINNIYNMFLFSDLIISESQLYISSGLSTKKVAEQKCRNLGIEPSEKNITKYQNKILYENRKYTDLFEININAIRRDNILKVLFTYPEINEELWKKIDNIIITILGEKSISYLNNKFIIHFPKVKFGGEISDKKLDELIDAIKPYAATTKKEFEQDLRNYENEIAYLSYILSPDSVLNKQDSERRESLQSLFDEESVKEYIASRKKSSDIGSAEGFNEDDIREVILTEHYQENAINKAEELEDEAEKLQLDICKTMLEAMLNYNKILKEDKKKNEEQETNEETAREKSRAERYVAKKFLEVVKMCQNSNFNGPVQYFKLLNGELTVNDFVKVDKPNEFQ